MTSTYGDIRNDVDDWLARSDLSGKAARFIEYAENRINRELRICAMERPYRELNAIDGRLPLPEDYLAIKDFYLYQKSTPIQVLNDTLVVPGIEDETSFVAMKSLNHLERISPEVMYRKFNPDCPAQPRYITRIQKNLFVSPYPDTIYVVAGHYYGRFPALSDDNDTNWLTDNAPELLLYGALAEASAYIQDQDQFALWTTRFEQVKAELEMADNDESLSGSSLQQKLV